MTNLKRNTHFSAYLFFIYIYLPHVLAVSIFHKVHFAIAVVAVVSSQLSALSSA